MRQNIAIIGAMTVVMLFSTSCAYNNEEELYASASCDTTAMNYTKINALLVNNTCMTCHQSSAAGASGGGYNLEGYTNLIVYAADGQLLKSVEHDISVSPMPKGGNKISDCDISKIKRWVLNGYPQ